jgi:hypothetical protein
VKAITLLLSNRRIPRAANGQRGVDALTVGTRPVRLRQPMRQCGGSFGAGIAGCPLASAQVPPDLPVRPAGSS